MALESTTLVCFNHVGHNGMLLCYCFLLQLRRPTCHWPRKQEQEMALGKLSKTGKRKQDEKHSATVSVELEAPSSKSKHLRVSTQFVVSTISVHLYET